MIDSNCSKQYYKKIESSMKIQLILYKNSRKRLILSVLRLNETENKGFQPKNILLILSCQLLIEVEFDF